MQVQTRRFGPITVADEDRFAVPDGIPGFTRLRSVTLLAAGEDLYWLQDLDDGDLAFLCIIPWGVFPWYDVEVDEQELGVADAADVNVLNLVSVHRDGQARLTANLRAPVIVDVRARWMRQVILTDSRWAVSEPIVGRLRLNGVR
jgi:flagellar assembly factor FliW